MYANLGPPVAYNHRSLKTCDWSSVSLERAVVTVCHDFQVSHIELPHALRGLFHHMVCIRGFSQLDFTDNCQKVLKPSIYFNCNPQLCFAFWALDPGCFPWWYSLLSLVLITSQTFPKTVPGSLTG